MVALLASAGTATAQSFDYQLQSVQILRIDPHTGDSLVTDQLDEYLLYDLGPKPDMQFVVTVAMAKSPSRLARYVDLKIERHIWLSSNSANESVDENVGEKPHWVYNASILLPYDRTTTGDRLVCFTTASTQLDFLDPTFPSAQAPPQQYTIKGYSYRFFLVPTNPSYRDSNMEDNSRQLTFIFQ